MLERVVTKTILQKAIKSYTKLGQQILKLTPELSAVHALLKDRDIEGREVINIIDKCYLSEFLGDDKL